MTRRPGDTATPRAKAETAAILVGFALYTAFALKLLLFSRVPGSERSFNLVPFAGITTYVLPHSPGAERAAFANVAGNILLFIPLGLYGSWLRHRVSAWLIMLVFASVSVAVEIIQGVVAVGASDIDDVILNCVGGLIGMLALWLLSKLLHERPLIRTAVAGFSLLSVPVWCYFLFVIRLRL